MCVFKYADWPLTTGILLKYLLNKKKTARIAIKPWEYHTADLYQALSEKLVRALGGKAEQSMQQALTDFEAKCGSEARQQIMKISESTDFNQA
jgi:hypothetical protein